MNYKTLLPSERIFWDGGIAFPAKQNFHLIVNWSKDLYDKTIKVLDIPTLPKVFDGFFLELNRESESGCAVSSVEIFTDTRTIKVNY